MTTKEDFFSSFSLAPVPIVVNGKTVHVRPLSDGEGMEVRELQKLHPDKRTRILFVRSLCLPDGTRLFSDDDALGDAPFLLLIVEAVVAKAVSLNVPESAIEASEGKG